MLLNAPQQHKMLSMVSKRRGFINPDVFPKDAFKSADATDRALNEDRPMTPQPLLQQNNQQINYSPQPGPSSARTPSPVRNAEPTVPILSESNIYYSPKDIFSLPNAGEARAPERKMRKGKTMVLTSSPNHKELKKAANKTQISKAKKKMIKKDLMAGEKTLTAKERNIEEVTSSDSSLEVNSSCDSDNSDIEFSPKPNEFNIEAI
ncbi:unnamed protein product [Acanthoscelides obtectus]|uniref:Uncharacterized protein n=1 Tax=Acanthoscelides obtectus TaxID=200917 RepID=A0A9P0K994_ACAOB|nr:unnamed protein product [Acanthoscelides obtectus]CAK1623062.1 hypothetical protein AOBTE_LOCUS1794 [Acanthoscelides obtectus]